MADYFSNFVEYFPRLMEGLKLTIIIAIFGILLAVALGIILCIFLSAIVVSYRRLPVCISQL